jgi:hypothetical protein
MSGSIVPCICGWVIGAAYASNVANVKKWRVPVWMGKMASKYILPLLVTNSKSKSNNRRSRTSADNVGSSRSSPPPLPPQQESPIVVSEESIDTMVAMFPDYSRENIKDALVRSNQDLNHAADILLQSGGN